jgi:hypothetical protein
MVKRLFLHIGTPKSGTTSIQRTLCAFSDSRDEPELYYPKSGRRARRLVGHHNLAYELYDPSKYEASLGGWADLAEELETVESEVAFLSSEAFRGFLAPVTAAKLRKLFSHLDNRVVLYLRPQWSYLESGYNQLFRFGRFHDSALAFYEGTGGRILDYRSYIEAWQKSMGKENVICLPFTPELMRDGVVTHLIDNILGRSIDLPEVERSNSKAGLLGLAATRDAQAELRELTGDPNIELTPNTAQRLSLLFRDEPEETFDYTFFDQESLDRIYDDAISTNRWLAEEFDGFDTPSFLERPTPGHRVIATVLPVLSEEQKARYADIVKAAAKSVRRARREAKQEEENAVNDEN